MVESECTDLARKGDMDCVGTYVHYQKMQSVDIVTIPNVVDKFYNMKVIFVADREYFKIGVMFYGKRLFIHLFF